MASLSHKDDLLETPPDVLKQIEDYTGLKIGLDVCASDKNKLCNNYFTKKDNALNKSWWPHSLTHFAFCNPPRSNNKKFVLKALDEWKKDNFHIIILMCWNDFGNNYGQKVFNEFGKIQIHNLGKIKFFKNGKITKHVSRLSYCCVWLKAQY